MRYSLTTPISGLNWLQNLLWPLIYFQMVALREWVHAKYGYGTPYWVSITPFGRVILRHLPADFATGETASFALEKRYETAAYDYSAGLTRALLAAACAAEETPPAPLPVPAILLPETQSGQKEKGWAPAHPDTS